APIETALERQDRSIGLWKGAQLLSALQRRAEELAADSRAGDGASPKVIKGTGPLVGVLKLKHRE
ncbi:MAG TPA: hypothetical protein VJ302_24465, partial [Blastocatellia bacterium]|nr:hypothetical protein [Blastocatellia bacterium]